MSAITLRNNTTTTTTTTTEDGIVRARQQTRESPKDNERPLRTGINRKKINTKNKFQTIFRFANSTTLFIVRRASTYTRHTHTHTHTRIHTHAQTHTQTHAHTLTHTSVPHTHAFVARRRSIQRPLITRGSSDAPRDGHVVILVCAGPTTTSRQLHSPVKIQIPRHQLNNYNIIIFFSLYIQHFNVGTYYEIHIRRVIILLSTASARLYF